MLRDAKAREIVANKLECGWIIQMMRSGMRINETLITTRGLERYQSDAYQAARRRRKEAVVRAVLENQHAQRKIGNCHPESLRLASLNTSCISRDIALDFGVWDEWVIRREFKIPRKEQKLPRKELQTPSPEHFSFYPPKQIMSDSGIELCHQESVIETSGSGVRSSFQVIACA